MKNRQEWIKAGYQMVSENDFTNVNIESISRLMNKSKSSFYNYFGDWEGFEETLLDHHLMIAKQFAVDTKNCQNIIPDLINVFTVHKTNIFFHKYLRIHREKPAYKKCFESVYNMFEEAILDTWCSFLKLENQSFLATKILRLLSENFFLQITYEKYDHKWLKNYLLEVSKLFIDLNTVTKK